MARENRRRVLREQRFARRRDEATGSEAFRGKPWNGLFEPGLVPRHASAAESWVLALRHRAADAHGALLVLDTAHVADGPAAVPLPCRVVHGFHGAFAGAGA